MSQKEKRKAGELSIEKIWVSESLFLLYPLHLMSLFVSFFVDQLRPLPTDVLFEWHLLDINCILFKNELLIWERETRFIL